MHRLFIRSIGLRQGGRRKGITVSTPDPTVLFTQSRRLRDISEKVATGAIAADDIQRQVDAIARALDQIEAKETEKEKEEVTQ